MLIHNRGPLAAALRILNVKVPSSFNVDNALVERFEEEAAILYPDLDEDAVQFVSRIRAAEQAEKDIRDRITALEAERVSKALLEEQIRTADLQKQ